MVEKAIDAMPKAKALLDNARKIVAAAHGKIRGSCTTKRRSAQIKVPQITVLDAGGQYCHLIARKVRDLGVYAEVRPSETPGRELAGRKGLIISGGPEQRLRQRQPHGRSGDFQQRAMRCWASATASS